MTKPPLPGAAEADSFAELLKTVRPDPVREAYNAYARDPSRCGRQDDSFAMNYACAELHDRMMRYERPTDHQLKIGPVNYYPNTGTVHIDGVRGSKKGLSQSQAFDLILKHYK